VSIESGAAGPTELVHEGSLPGPIEPVGA